MILQRNRGRNRRFKDEFRTLFVLLFFMCMSAVARTDDDTQSTLVVLMADFENKNPEIQKSVLRHIGRLASDQAAPFLFANALDPMLDNDIHREALKALLAIDSQKYQRVLEPLSKTVVEFSDVLAIMNELSDVRYTGDLVRLIGVRKLPSREARSALLTVLSLWDGRSQSQIPFELWKNKSASEVLAQMVMESKGERRQRGLIAMGLIRDKAATNVLIRHLHDPDLMVASLAIKSLGNPGVDSAPALGRFLAQSPSEELRRIAIESLGKLKTPSAKRSLRAYRTKAKPAERELIDSFL